MLLRSVHIPTSVRILQDQYYLLMNYVDLKPGIPRRLHFTDHYFITRLIADRESGKDKPVKSLVFWVDEVEGEDDARTFSILSDKLASHFKPFLAEKRYTGYDFIITKIGDGMLADFNVQPILRRE